MSEHLRRKNNEGIEGCFLPMEINSAMGIITPRELTYPPDKAYLKRIFQTSPGGIC